jgi:hypothetical protein
LVLDENSEDSDIFLFFVPALVVNRSVAKLTSRVTALLWCNYRGFSRTGLIDKGNGPKALVEPFITGVFGLHVSQHEVNAWKELESAFETHDTPRKPGVKA